MILGCCRAWFDNLLVIEFWCACVAVVLLIAVDVCNYLVDCCFLVAFVKLVDVVTWIVIYVTIYLLFVVLICALLLSRLFLFCIVCVLGCVWVFCLGVGWIAGCWCLTGSLLFGCCFALYLGLIFVVLIVLFSFASFDLMFIRICLFEVFYLACCWSCLLLDCWWLIDSYCDSFFGGLYCLN